MFKDAAEAIHSPIETTLIFEDSPTGIHCAHAAGFKHIVHIKKEEDSMNPLAEYSIKDFTELL
jgi:beta-phosphoglucomutase-like phosphatase (HAD superfamily)